MTDINNFISEITKEKDRLDMPVFLNFLRDELDQKGIRLTINRSSDLHLVPFNMSNIIGVELDLFDHDKKKDTEIKELKTELKDEKIKNGFFNNADKYLNNMVREKDAEIEKYKNAFESVKCERDKAVCEYQNKIDKLTAENAELYCEMQAMSVYPYESICKPIKMADWIVHHFKQGMYPGYERDDSGNIKCVELGGEKILVQTGEYENYTEVREIADYLLAYCKYHSEE